jgi:hypothetical protein
MMALVALRDPAKVFGLTTAGRLIAVFRTVAEDRRAGLGV